jgi:hypothetical protein
LAFVSVGGIAVVLPLTVAFVMSFLYLRTL